MKGCQTVDQQRLQRVFDILEYLAVCPATVSEVSRELNIPLSSAHDLLQAMLKVDAVAMRGRRYMVGFKAIGVSTSVLGSNSVQQMSRSHVEQVARVTGCCTRLAVPGGDRVTYAVEVLGARSAQGVSMLGQPVVLHATAVGRLFAAYDPDINRRLHAELDADEGMRTRREQVAKQIKNIRATGHSVAREGRPGWVSLAMPIRDSEGELVSAVQIDISPDLVSSMGREGVLSTVSDSVVAIENAMKRVAPVAI
jgi:DNA-binding IclR family transcriptional regulator